MAFTAKILSCRFRHLNIVGCLLKRRPTKGGSRAPQDPPSYAPVDLNLDYCSNSTTVNFRINSARGLHFHQGREEGGWKVREEALSWSFWPQNKIIFIFSQYRKHKARTFVSVWRRNYLWSRSQNSISKRLYCRDRRLARHFIRENHWPKRPLPIYMRRSFVCRPKWTRGDLAPMFSLRSEREVGETSGSDG